MKMAMVIPRLLPMLCLMALSAKPNHFERKLVIRMMTFYPLALPTILATLWPRDVSAPNGGAEQIMDALAGAACCWTV